MNDPCDHIRLKDLRFWGRHGHLPSERELGNRFEVDVDLQLDVTRAAEVDRIDLTVDLAQVYEMIRSLLEGKPCELLETLAWRLADQLSRLDKVEAATVWVRKLNPPLSGAIDGFMEVEVTRRAQR
jgi:dihydroneopterin aldolase